MIRSVSFIVLVLCCSGRLSAGFSYEVSFNNAPNMGNTVVQLQLGATVGLPVYFHEIRDLGETALSPLGTTGLKKANVFLGLVSGDSTITTMPAGTFPNQTVLFDISFAQIEQSSDVGVKGTINALNSNVYSLQIATIPFEATTTPNVTEFSFTKPNEEPFDFEVTQFGTLSIVAVPEPNSAMLAILASGYLCLRRNRQRGLGESL
jgi:hypothetical protein